MESSKGRGGARRSRTADVVVVGSGAAALVAALRARDQGARVVVIEKTDRIGGASAVSGGVLWIPQNHHMAELGVADSREDALTYLRRGAFGHTTDAMLETFVDQAPVMLRYLEGRTPLRFTAVRKPDYHPEWAGGRPAGRSLDNLPFDLSALGEHRDLLRRGPHMPPVTYVEQHRWTRIDQFDWQLIADRIERGIVTLGGALVGGLLQACLESGVELRVGTRVRRLTRARGRVTGVQVTDRAGADVDVRATKGVVIATGGFEWNVRMRTHFLRGPLTAPLSPPWNTGDGILMGLGVGANIANMTEAAWYPALRIPGEEYDGHVLNRLVSNERTKPGSIVVNRRGRRFGNEAACYDDFARWFHVFDPAAYTWANVPAHLVFDERFRRRYNVATAMPGEPAPPWFARGGTLEELAAAIDVDAAGLEETVERFNRFAAAGVDDDFHRGESAFDRVLGDPDCGPNPCLGSLDTPPFYAVELLPGTVGTKGGLQCDAGAHVLDVEDRVIPGLYACGAAMASAVGIAYAGAGGMLGPGMTFAYLGGAAAAAGA